MFLSDAAVERLRGTAANLGADRYTLIQELGRGGMGTVYLATDALLGREVAVKVPHASSAEGLERRLQTEARVLASLEHPGIVPIHDAGRLGDGRLFYVMKLVRGRTLRAHLDDVPGLGERLRIFERICEPVAFAHARGFIHRDLKPENVMVGAFGEVMVMDWGVAKLLGSSAEAPPESAVAIVGEVTLPGTVIGTRGFMAPEQARGSEADVGARADVYGLGALLLFMLTDTVPAADGGAAASAAGRRDIPKPLRAVCARALAADPSDRYSTVAELAADIARFRADEAVEAQRETLLDRAGRFGRTYRAAILLVLAYVIMRAVVAFTVGW
jgi:eukaryotic-like serine/threonine-protein kinase